MVLSRSKMVNKYIFFELLPVFLMGVLMFVFILFMFQSFKLSEYVIVHEAKIRTVIEIFAYFTLGFMPIVLPTALLFAVLLVYGRLSQDSEIVVLKSMGLHPIHFSLPAIFMGLLVTLFAWQISTSLGPWGHRKADEMVHKLTQNRPAVAVREGVFSEGFFDLVVYANQVDTSKGILHKVFIYDERDSNSPLTIIASEGEILTENTDDGQKAFLRLKAGNMHRTSADYYTKIDFDTYDIKLFDPKRVSEKDVQVDNLDLQALEQYIQKVDDKKKKFEARQELYRRWSFPFNCLVFSVIGLGLGTVTNRRTARTGSLVICISVVMVYWILYAAFGTLAKQEIIPLAVAAWTPNILGLGFGIRQWIKMVKV